MYINEVFKGRVNVLIVHVITVLYKVKARKVSVNDPFTEKKGRPKCLQ